MIIARSRWREIAVSAGFTEGPVAYGDADVAFVSINRGRLYRTGLGGGEHSDLVEVGGGPNGLAMDGSGRIWIAQNGGRVMDTKSWATEPSVQVLEPDADPRSIGGPALQAPNDCAFGPDGRLYLTDPFRRGESDGAEGPKGRVWAYDPLAAAFELVADGLAHPNGLCFTPDGDLLVSDTAQASILRFVRGRGGPWRSGGVVADVPRGQPDGMALDEAGRLWVATTTGDGLAVLDVDGTWSFVDMGATFPTNLCFAGRDRATLVVTAARGGRVLATEVDTPGLTLHAPALPRVPESPQE